MAEERIRLRSNIEGCDRLSKFWSMSEDEDHILINCTKYKEGRIFLFEKIT